MDLQRTLNPILRQKLDEIGALLNDESYAKIDSKIDR